MYRLAGILEPKFVRSLSEHRSVSTIVARVIALKAIIGVLGTLPTVVSQVNAQSRAEEFIYTRSDYTLLYPRLLTYEHFLSSA